MRLRTKGHLRTVVTRRTRLRRCCRPSRIIASCARTAIRSSPRSGRYWWHCCNGSPTVRNRRAVSTQRLAAAAWYRSSRSQSLISRRSISMRIDLVGTTADFRVFGLCPSLQSNHLLCENRRTAGRIGEDGLTVQPSQMGYSGFGRVFVETTGARTAKNSARCASDTNNIR